MKNIVTFFILMLVSAVAMAQYENKGIIIVGSGILENETYKSIVILGEPGAAGDMVDSDVYSLTPGFIYVVDEPLESVLGLTIELEELTAYPNPTTKMLNLSYSVNQNLKELMVEVLDMGGRKMMGTFIPASKGKHAFQLDVGHLQEAIYILSIKSPEDTFQTHLRFVKK